MDLSTILETPKFLKYFKLYATHEFSVENVIFWEEVQNYKKLKEKERNENADKIIDAFMKDDSIYEINTTQKLIKQMEEEKKKECHEEIFDPIVKDVKNTNMMDTYQRFLSSALYKEMMEKKRKKTYFLFQ